MDIRAWFKLKRQKCEHEWVPLRYGVVTGMDIVALIDECVKCGARIARTQ